ncbi:MAG: multidrug efflux SMR transporter [Nocardioides sp.]|uniref:DMT family transporter n=1 Tax=Nocardioides sp. TaxID=35761 RepID=UPI0039E3A7BA
MLLAIPLLFVAIAAEVAATTVLPRTAGFTDVGWSVVVLVGYGLSIWLLTVVVKAMPVSVAYAIWAGLGTAAVAVVGAIFLDEPMSLVKMASVALIILGVVGLNLTGAH